MRISIEPGPSNSLMVSREEGQEKPTVSLQITDWDTWQASSCDITETAYNPETKDFYRLRVIKREGEVWPTVDFGRSAAAVQNAAKGGGK